MGKDGFVSANPFWVSLIDRVRQASRETFWRRMLIWAVAVAAVAVVAKLSLPRGVHTPSRPLLASMLVLEGCGGFATSVYYFARFVLCREIRFLLGAAAFSALGWGAALQAIADFGAPEPALHGWILTSAWLVAAVLFTGAAFSESALRPASRRDAVVQSAFGLVAVIAFPVVASPYALDYTLLYALSSSADSAFACYVIDTVACAAALSLCLMAFMGNYRRYRTEQDRMAGLVCYFLVPCILGLLFRTVSATRFDDLWLSAQVMISGAWVVLMVVGGVENAFAHREATGRLSEMEALHQVSWSLVGAGTLHELLDLLVRTLVAKLGAKIAVVFLDDGEDNLEVAAACGPTSCADSVGARYPFVSTDRRPGFHTGHTAKALTTREVQIASDVFVDVELVPWREIAGDEGCAVSLPLVDGEKAIGVLDVYFADCRQLTGQLLKLLGIVAAAATPAVQNARTREVVDTQQNDLEHAA